MEYVTDVIKVLMDLVFDYAGELEHSEDLSDYPKEKLVKDFILYHAVDGLFENFNMVKEILAKHGDGFWNENHSDMEGGEENNLWIVDEIVDLLAEEGYELQLVKK